jgi:hypothetical protein
MHRFRVHLTGGQLSARRQQILFAKVRQFKCARHQPTGGRGDSDLIDGGWFSTVPLGGFCFSGVRFSRNVDGSIRRESPHHRPVCLKPGFGSRNSYRGCKRFRIRYLSRRTKIRPLKTRGFSAAYIRCLMGKLRACKTSSFCERQGGRQTVRMSSLRLP